jgi:glycosyltransferase involved in cell wall biosynthesis
MKSTKAIVVLPYGLAPARRQALRAAAAPAEIRWRKKKISFIGMWSPRKGGKDWREIIQRIRARVPDASFLFLGTMTANDNVMSDLDPTLAGLVEIVPQFEPDQLPQLLSDCAVGAFPSYVEGFGLAVVEQLAAGIPTVAYAAPGPGDILKESLPELLVSTGDVAGFSETIADIFTKDLSAYQALADRSVETAARFSWPEIAQATIEEYRARLEGAVASGRTISSGNANS